MTQEYTPVAWQDETTSQQGTLINAERLNQMQTAHHYADGLEEVDAIPTADPGVSYHKIVYCTADSTIYRWDGTEWTKDIDDETKALLQQEIARATAAESELRGQLEDEHDARVDAEAAINDRITDETTELAQRIATEASTRYTADTALGTRITNETSARETADTALGNRITAEATARADADTALGGRIDTEQARAEAAEQANAQAIANTYTKAEIDTALALKADQATTYTKTEADTLLATKADVATTYTKTETDALLGAKANDNAVVHKAYDEDITGIKTCTYSAIGTNPARADLGRIRIKASNVDITNNPHGVEAPSIQWLDSANHICGVINTEYEADGSSQVILGPRRANGNLSWFIMNPDYMAVPTPGTGAPSNAVATLATLDGYLPMVRTTGNQNVRGYKIFEYKPNIASYYVMNANLVSKWVKVCSYASLPNYNDMHCITRFISGHTTDTDFMFDVDIKQRSPAYAGNSALFLVNNASVRPLAINRAPTGTEVGLVAIFRTVDNTERVEIWGKFAGNRLIVTVQNYNIINALPTADGVYKNEFSHDNDGSFITWDLNTYADEPPEGTLTQYLKKGNEAS